MAVLELVNIVTGKSNGTENDWSRTLPGDPLSTLPAKTVGDARA